MNITKSEWNGFQRLDFEFKGRSAILICPNKPICDNKWLYKTEYFGAFPSLEIAMLNKGYYLAHLQNKSRWCPEEDTELRADFCDFLTVQFGLNKKCVPVGMSCGGMQAVYFAARYPEYVAALYLDAPVMNLLSCPYALGSAEVNFIEEFEDSMKMGLEQLINYRNHPIDNVPSLVKNNIPVILVCGDSDKTVPYLENGKQLADYYKNNNGIITEIVKSECDHHPHGLDDNQPIMDFIERYY